MKEGKKRVLVVAPTGCHEGGQPILLHSKQVKTAAEIKTGDRLMGPDGLPRSVRALCRGAGEMFRITPDNPDHEPFIVNLDHILTVAEKRPGSPLRVIDVSVFDAMEHKTFGETPARTGLWLFKSKMRKEYIDHASLTGFTIQHVGTGEYFGWKLTGDRRYLLADHTVTHNSGKGFTSARLMQMAASKGSQSLFLAAQRELIFQIGNQLDRLGVPRSTILAGYADEYEGYEDAAVSSLCNIAAKDTLLARGIKRNKIVLPSADVVHIDEAHQSLAPTYQRIMKEYEDSIILGWTATPCRADGLSLGQYYDAIVPVATYAELQAAGHLTPVDMIAPTRPNLKGLGGGQDYNQKKLPGRMNLPKITGSILEEWKKHSNGRQTVAFLSSVEHSIFIRDLFREYLGKNADGSERAEHIDGKMSNEERADILGRVKDGRVLVTTNYNVLATGVDIPAWKYMICARPTKSFSLWRQQAGRVQRPYQSTPAMIQDHSDNGYRFGFPDEDVAWTLDDGIKAENLPRTQRKKPPHQAKEPYACRACGTPYQGAQCPSCGHKPQILGKNVIVREGELFPVEREQSAAAKKAKTEDKQAYWDKCLGIAIHRKAKVGAAVVLYQKQFGTAPGSDIKNVPLKSQWGMSGGEFYHTVVKPARIEAERISREQAETLSGQQQLFNS